jgi:hypothetical protein
LSCADSPALKTCPGSLVQSCSVCHLLPVSAVLFYMPSACPILLFPLWLSCSGSPFLPSYPGCPVPAVLARLSWFSYPTPSVLLWLSCGYCPESPVLADLLSLSCFACPVLAVLFWLYHSGCLILAVLFYSPVLAVSFCLLLSVLRWLSYPNSPVLADLSCLTHSGCPVLNVLFLLSLFWLSLFWLFISGRPFLLDLFYLSDPNSPVLAALSWQSCPEILSWQ